MTKNERRPAFCTQCRSRCGCEVILENDQLIRIEPLPSHPSGEKLCPKGKAAAELIYHPDRLKYPMRRTSPKGMANPTWKRVCWQEALDEIAGQMKRIKTDHGAEQVAFSITTPSGTHMSDCISWVERFIRAYGSPNSIYSTEICNWHKDIASRLTYGTDIGTPDFANTDCILLWGHNPAATWLARSVEIQKAVKRGAKLIVVDPRATFYAKRADCWLQVQPGTDQALALGIANLLLKSDRFDQEFVREWTNAGLLVREDTGAFLKESDISSSGSDEVLFAASANTNKLIKYDQSRGIWSSGQPDLIASRQINTNDGIITCRSSLKIFAEVAAEYTPERIIEATGIGEEQLKKAAEIISESASIAYYAWNGVGQSTTASQTDRAISILYGLTGSYGRKGGNVPGSAAPFNDISGHDLLNKNQRSKALGLAKRPIGPGLMGWVMARDVYSAVLEKTPYQIRMLMSFGGNLLASQPETDRAKRAFEKLEFHVHCDFFLNETAKYADIVLPVSTSWEREGLRTGFDSSLEGMRRVQLKLPVISPIGEARSDTDVALELARRLGLSKVMFNCDPNQGYAYILASSGVNLEELRANPEGVNLPNAVGLCKYREKGFPTPTKLLEIYSEQMLCAGFSPVPYLDTLNLPAEKNSSFPLKLSCAKTIAYCHSQGRNIPSLRRLAPDPIVEISVETATERGIKMDDWVKIKTRTGHFIARAKLDKNLNKGAIFAQHGWTVSDVHDDPNWIGDPLVTNMNQAISTEECDPISGSLPMRCSWCEVSKI